MKKTSERLVIWMREQVLTAGCKGTVVGLSGGVDSAVAAALCRIAFPQTNLALMLPCHSIPDDLRHAEMVAETLDIPTQTIYLDEVYDGLRRLLAGDQLDPETAGPAESNLKPRLRMTALYYYASRTHRFVVGCSNRCELEIGYFTKYGDGGADILPLGNLLKSQVVDLAGQLGVPEEIVAKPPSAGLWPGQTDEAEMGLTYAQIEDYLTGKEVPGDVAKRIQQRVAANAHKRRMPPVPDF